MKSPSNRLYFTQGHKKLRRSLNPDLCVSGAMTMTNCLGLPGTIPVSGSKPAYPGNSSVPGTLGQWVPLSGKHHIKWVQLQEMRSQVTCEVCPKIQVIDHHVCFLFSFHYYLSWYKTRLFGCFENNYPNLRKHLWDNKFRNWLSHWHIKGPMKYYSNNSSLALSEEHSLSKQITI